MSSSVCVIKSLPISKKKHVTTPSRHHIVRPFSPLLSEISDRVFGIVKELFIKGYIPSGMVLKKFNSCVVLVYYNKSLVSYKSEVQLPLHRDCTYGPGGTLNAKQNSQEINTGTYVVTLGDSRSMRWMLTDGTPNNPFRDVDLDPVELRHGSLFVLHSHDEIPSVRHRYKDISASLSYFKHGGVRHGGRTSGVSVALVYRTTNQFRQINQNGLVHQVTNDPKWDVLDKKLDDFMEEELHSYMSSIRKQYKNMRHTISRRAR